jgi:FkbM family methyltransferase
MNDVSRDWTDAMTADSTRTINDDHDATDQSFFDAPWGTHQPHMLQNLLIGVTRRTFLQRGRLRHRMTNLITSLGRPIDVRFRDCKFRIAGRNNLIEYGLLTRPSYNGIEIDFLSAAVRDGGVALDIGCNIGLYSLPLAKAAGPRGRVLSIDANPAMIQHLNFNAQASDLKIITGLNVAVGGTRGRVDLKIRRDDVAIVSVVENDAGAVPMLPLSDIVEQAGLSRVDALKIDIEGHEDYALVPYLKSAPEALLPSRIVIEQASRGTDYPGCAAEFARLGYRLQERTKINSLYERA